MKYEINYCLSLIRNILHHFILRILLVLCINVICFSTQATDRFAATNLNAPANSFNNRFTASSLNVDFLIAHVLNNARQIERLGEEFRENTSFITDQINTIDGAISNSVIVPPGNDADTIIVINMNEGDSFAIQR